MKHTPLYQEHMAMGGQMANYKGYALPNQYLGVEDEHRSVREKSGLFDRSYLTRVLIFGAQCSGVRAAHHHQRRFRNGGGGL